MVPAAYGAVLVNDAAPDRQPEVAGVAPSGAGREGDKLAAVDDRRFLVLAHPGESRILESAGFTWDEVFRQGRYVAVDNVVCRRCGTAFPRRRLAAPNGAGCLPSLLTGAAVGVGVGSCLHSAIAGLVAGWAGLFVVLHLVDFRRERYLRQRFPARRASLAAERRCPTCSADDARSIDGARSIPCPSCRAPALRFRPVGIS